MRPQKKDSFGRIPIEEQGDYYEAGHSDGELQGFGEDDQEAYSEVPLSKTQSSYAAIPQSTSYYGNYGSKPHSNIKHEAPKTSKKNGADHATDSSKSYNVFRSEVKKMSGTAGEGTESKNFGNFGGPKSVRKTSMTNNRGGAAGRIAFIQLLVLS